MWKSCFICRILGRDWTCFLKKKEDEDLLEDCDFMWCFMRDFTMRVSSKGLYQDCLSEWKRLSERRDCAVAALPSYPAGRDWKVIYQIGKLWTRFWSCSLMRLSRRLYYCSGLEEIYLGRNDVDGEWPISSACSPRKRSLSAHGWVKCKKKWKSFKKIEFYVL